MVDTGTLLVVGVVVLVVLFVIGRSLFGRMTIYEFQRGLRFKGGRLTDVLGPGQHWVYRPTTYVQHVDIREIFLPITGQEVVTADSVSVKLSLVARYRIADPLVAVTKVESYLGALHSLIQVALREVVTSKTIEDVLAKRSEIGPEVLARCADDLKSIGLELVAVDVRDLMFPGALKKTFAQVLEAKQQGLAALERARAETAALRGLANAARMVEANPALLQLRLIEQLESTRGHTIVMGLPSSSTPLPMRSQASTAELPEGDGQSSPSD